MTARGPRGRGRRADRGHPAGAERGLGDQGRRAAGVRARAGRRGRRAGGPAGDGLAVRGPRRARRSTVCVDVDVTVVVSSGTYVRALARDLGAGLGVGGHLTALRRTRVGGYGLDVARTLDELAEVAPDVPIDVVSLADSARATFPVRELTPEESVALSYGQRLSAADDARPRDRSPRSRRTAAWSRSSRPAAAPSDRCSSSRRPERAVDGQSSTSASGQPTAASRALTRATSLSCGCLAEQSADLLADDRRRDAPVRVEQDDAVGDLLDLVLGQLAPQQREQRDVVLLGHPGRDIPRAASPRRGAPRWRAPSLGHDRVDAGHDRARRRRRSTGRPRTCGPRAGGGPAPPSQASERTPRAKTAGIPAPRTRLTTTTRSSAAPSKYSLMPCSLP